MFPRQNRGAAHGPLWAALRKKGRQVRVIGIAVENANVDRTARLLEAWAAADPGTPAEGLTVKQEIKAITEAMKGDDEEFLARYEGWGGGVAYARRIGGGGWRMLVDNSLESHKPVEISDLRASSDSRSGRAKRGPTRPGEAADGPLRVGKGEISGLAGLD